MERSLDDVLSHVGKKDMSAFFHFYDESRGVVFLDRMLPHGDVCMSGTCFVTPETPHDGLREAGCHLTIHREGGKSVEGWYDPSTKQPTEKWLSTLVKEFFFIHRD